VAEKETPMTTEQRLARLERENRWMRRVATLSVALLAACVLVGQGTDAPSVVKARAFILVDASGKYRAVLGADNENGLPSTNLTLFDHEGVKRVELGAGSGGACGLWLHSKRRVRAGLAVGGDAGPADLAIADKDGNLRVQVYAWKRGEPAIVLRDHEKAVRVRLSAAPEPKIDLLDMTGGVIWQAPSATRMRLQVEIASAFCKDYYDSAKTWRMIKKKYPDSLEEMAAPLRRGEEDFLRVEDDPWGNPYVLKRKGNQLRVYSWGPDGKEGTDDDVVYPEGK
jgi:hypothetical protein